VSAPLGGIIPSIRSALREDGAWNDVTTACTIVAGTLATGRILCREPAVLAGLEIAAKVFLIVERDLAVEVFFSDGETAGVNDVVLSVSGEAAAILAAERTALNFLQHLSGIATETRKYVTAVEDTKARIVDTRKTIPGLRAIQKHAITCGGGHNHRRGLSDGLLIKDNHIAAVGSISKAVHKARESAPHPLRIEVEVDVLEQIEPALTAGADVILLDNMNVATIRTACQMIGGRALVEASGGITLATVVEVAGAGVDFISVGALTHSVKAVDFSLELAVATA
jgi:nicotinate-nucleotide pyrophosphorylase (carboxylating)